MILGNTILGITAPVYVEVASCWSGCANARHQITRLEVPHTLANLDDPADTFMPQDGRIADRPREASRDQMLIGASAGCAIQHFAQCVIIADLRRRYILNNQLTWF